MLTIDHSIATDKDIVGNGQDEEMSEHQLLDFFLDHRKFFSIQLYFMFYASDITETEVDDILQEVSLKLFCGKRRKIKDFVYTNENAYLAWLKRIVINTAFDFFESEGRKVVSKYAHPHPRVLHPDDYSTVDRVYDDDYFEKPFQILYDTIPQPHERMEQQEMRQQMRNRIASALSPEQFEVISMKFFDGMEHKEIATVLQENLSTIGSRILASINLLRQTRCLSDLVFQT